MNIQKYENLLNNTPEPIGLNDMNQKVDIRGIMKYAKGKGIKVEQLSEEEKLSFIKDVEPKRKDTYSV